MENCHQYLPISIEHMQNKKIAYEPNPNNVRSGREVMEGEERMRTENTHERERRDFFQFFLIKLHIHRKLQLFPYISKITLYLDSKPFKILVPSAKMSRL